MTRTTIIALVCLAALPAAAQAQTSDKPTDKSGYSTGTTKMPETKGQLQPQGYTGPINTGQGGAPAESPQGQSPPGMQAAPEGSSKTTVSPDANTK